MFKNHPINWAAAAFLAAYHLLALSAFAFPFQWHYLPIMVGFYLFIGFGTTFYLHRYLTHKSFETIAPIKFMFALANAVGQQGDPVSWVGHHRWHHAKSDKPGEDVHTPKDGFWYSHFEWIIRSTGEEDRKLSELANDVRKYWYCRALENKAVFFLTHAAFAALAYFTLGLGGMLWCLYVPMIVCYHSTFAVNSLCHMRQFGYRTTETNENSRNFWLVGLMALGEGWHNNHHACQTRARAGIAWYEIDFTTYLIWTLEKVGLVWNVRWNAPVRSTELTPSPEAVGATL